MRTTLSLIGERVASAGDFMRLGEGVHKSPMRHAFVDFDYDGADAFTLLWVGDIDDGKTLATELSVTAMNAIGKHCRAYFNLIQRLNNAPAQ